MFLKNIGGNNMGFLTNLPEWFVIGPLFGITVATMYAISNKPLGATGTYAQITDLIFGRTMKEPWRLWYLFGVILGAAIVTWLGSGGGFGSISYYGKLGDLIPMEALIPLLFIGGVLMGVGARLAGGCTSGHGLCGTSTLSPGSIMSTMTFFGIAVVVTLILNLLTGGAL
jgi:uncharacterized membrane protein YedE/YeeE